MKYRYSMIILFFIMLSQSKVIADNRWSAFLKHDVNQIKRNINITTVLGTGGWLTGMYFLSKYDVQLNQSVKKLYSGKWKYYFNTVDQLGNGLYTGSISIGIAGLSLLGKNKKLQDAAFTSAESFVLTGVISTMTKFIVGRHRPNADVGPRCFSPFSSIKSSFPSGHASTAFALLTPWVVYYPSTYTYLFLLFPTSTAIARMVLNKHWFTDILTGSLLGLLIGYSLAKWHKNLAKKNNYYGGEVVPSYYSISFTIPVGGL